MRQGITVSLALPLNKQQDALNQNPFEHQVSKGEFGAHVVASDRYGVDYHGFAHSHMDGLPHFAHKGKMYNGVPFDDGIASTGAKRLGIHHAGVNGVFTRGVLMDMPRFLGVDYLEPGTAITVADLDALAAQAARLDRVTFLFVAAPLKVEGGTGSPLNPLAVF